MPLSEKIKRSKVVVDNSGTPDELIEKVRKLQTANPLRHLLAVTKARS